MLSKGIKPALDIIKLLSTKSKHWKYEEEYRLLYWDYANTVIEIGQACISEVFLGCKISKSNKEKILAITKEIDSNITVYQCGKSEINYELNFERIT